MWRIIYDANGNILFKIWSNHDDKSPFNQGLLGHDWGEIHNYNKGVLNSIHKIDVNTGYKKIKENLEKGNSFKNERGEDLSKESYHKDMMKDIDKRKKVLSENTKLRDDYYKQEGYKSNQIYQDNSDYSKKRMAEELQKSQNQNVNDNAYVTPTITPEIAKPNSTVSEPNFNNANTQLNNDMKPPQFILNSQGVITHKIVPQGNDKYRAFPTNANGNVISTDPNKSPTLDEATLMQQIGVMQRNGAKVIYDVPEGDVEVPETQMPLPNFEMPKVTDKFAPVDAELLKKYTEYNKPSPVIAPVQIQRPIPQNIPLANQINNASTYDYEKTPEMQAIAQAVKNNQAAPPNAATTPQATNTTGTATTTGVAANNGANGNPTPTGPIDEVVGISDNGPGYITKMIQTTAPDGSKTYRRDYIEVSSGKIIDTMPLTKEVVINNVRNSRVKVEPKFFGKGEVLEGVKPLQIPTTNTTIGGNPPAPTPTLVKPDTKTKEGITELQKRIGMSANEIDGKMGPNTRKRIAEYQKANGLIPDGSAGPKTLAKLEQNAAANPQTTPTIVDPNADKADPNKKVDLAPITSTTTDVAGNPVTTTTLKGDTNRNGVIDGDEISEDVVLTVEKPTAEIATNNGSFNTSPFTRRVTHGIWEPFGNDEESLMEYRTRPIKRLYTNPQRQDTSTATVVNEFLGKTFGSREDRRDRRDNRRYENDRRDDREDARNNVDDNVDDEKILEGKEEKVRRRGPLFQNPMIDVARNVVNGKEKMPEFDNVRDARQFHRAVKQAQTFIRREDKAHNRNAAKYDRDQEKLREIRRKTEERLGIKYQTPNSPSQGNTSLPTSPTIDNNQTKTSSDVLSDINNNIFQNNKFNTMLNPPIYKGPVIEGKPNPLLKITEQVDDTTPLKTKRSGGQIMQMGNYVRPFKRPNNANWNLDGLDELPEYRFKENASADLLKKRFRPSTIYGTSQDAVNRAFGIKPGNKTGIFDIKPGNKTGIVADPINFIEGPDGSKTTTTQSGSTGAPYWNSRKLNVFGNQMQHEANMYPVMYNVGKSLFDKAEVQNPTYNKQDVAFLQGMKRNQIGLNMNPINDNRAAMNQAIRGNARGSGQILNAYAAAQNTASKNMNDEMYRVKNANQAQENNYLQALSQVGSNRREIDTLVDEKNRQHRLSFEKFQRDALESGEKAQINKGQMINQELSDKITMDNYLNQIGKNFQYKLQGDGTYMIEFEDFSGNKRKMSPNQTKATMEIMQKAEQDKQNTRQAELNAQAANDEKLKQNALTEEQRVKLKAYEDAEIRAAKEKKWNDEQAAKAKAEADAKAKGTNKTGGYIYKRKSF